ncbi:CPBP family intramembrane glutamic endopeptidase [Neobacillus sp. OS1-2]|uniref:CPBP family intramembrane glutamic endopeptidase n=1 Tax=Neobacillus sp. OS1-2 TaxID=3070680 RepID=UPI0027DEDAB1|nr:CPBP family intramembrane glutamic endopeptidase [Neobacillus sp. OS1-2]WML41253.1 CPBP family intramembrane glutamic endopeptidase [Neobacillus sp. OS1-2]
MTTNLTQLISKRLLFAMLIVTIGAEIFLYCMRYSNMASTLYDAMMVSSFFIGLKLHHRLQSPTSQPKTKRQLTLQFTGAFLIFFLGSTVINMFSTYTFQDFNTDYDQYVQDYTDIQMAVGEDIGTPAEEPVLSFFEKVDTIGYDLYADTLAGLEEVWRLAYMILLLVMFKKIFPRRWESGRRDIFLMGALFLTSILFGIDHTLDSVEPWSVSIGAIVTFANMGLLFGLILLWTRNLWVTVLVHTLYDITATLSWYYIDYAVELFALAVLSVHVTLFTMEKLKQRRLRQQLEVVELVKAAESP